MTRMEALLLTQVLALAAVVVGIIYALQSEPTGRAPGRIAPTVTAPALFVDEPAVADDAGEGGWVPLERLEYALGPWRSLNDAVFVSVSTKSSQQARTTPDALWRLTVERDFYPIISCGVYEEMRRDTDPPWRLGYCRGLAVDPTGPAVATRVSLFRTPGQQAVRLVLGGELDVEIYQVR